MACHELAGFQIIKVMRRCASERPAKPEQRGNLAQNERPGVVVLAYPGPSKDDKVKSRTTCGSGEPTLAVIGFPREQAEEQRGDCDCNQIDLPSGVSQKNPKECVLVSKPRSGRGSPGAHPGGEGRKRYEG